MDFNTVYLQVLKYLNYRPRSEKEIRDYLKKKLSSNSVQPKNKYSRNFGEQSDGRIDSGQTPISLNWRSRMTIDVDNNSQDNLIDLIIHKLKQQRFLNDLEFAKMWVRSRTSYKPKGEKLIRLELKQKGISNEIINEVFADTESRVQSDLELAIEIMEKKRRKFEVMERQERFRKAGSLLARRGFNLDIIKQAIDQVFGK